MGSVSTLVVLALSGLLALASSWVLLLPFFAGAETASNPAEQGKIEMLRRKERLLQQLADLEGDLLAKKLSAEDYEKSKAELLASTAEIDTR